MRLTRMWTAAAMAGVVLVGGVGAVVAQEDGSGAGPRERAHAIGALPRAIRGELVVRERDGEGFATIRIDRGVLTGVDGSTLRMKEADGTTVEVETSGATRVRRDGDEAAVGDLRTGDHVMTVRRKDGETFTTELVRALSPDRHEEMEARRGERRGPRRTGPRVG